MREGTEIEIFNAATIRTRLAQDMVPSEKHGIWLARMGMIRGSEEVAALEEADGQERRNNLRPILSTVDMLAAIASDLMQKAILLQRDKSVDDDDAVALGSLTMANVAVTRAVIAQLLDLGILKINGLTIEGTME